MKLLTYPSYTMETIKIGGEDVIETHVNLLGLFGLCPLTKTRTRKTAEVNMPGRMTANPIEVDFEAEEPPTEWNESLLRQMPKKQDVEFAVEGEGFRKQGITGFLLCGLFPIEHRHDNVWCCSFDYSETLPRKKQL